MRETRSEAVNNPLIRFVSFFVSPLSSLILNARILCLYGHFSDWTDRAVRGGSPPTTDGHTVWGPHGPSVDWFVILTCPDHEWPFRFSPRTFDHSIAPFGVCHNHKNISGVSWWRIQFPNVRLRLSAHLSPFFPSFACRLCLYIVSVIFSLSLCVWKQSSCCASIVFFPFYFYCLIVSLFLGYAAAAAAARALEIYFGVYEWREY